MSNELWHALIAAGVVAVLLIVAWRLNLHQPKAVIRAQFLMKERGLGSPLSFQERIGHRISLVKKLQGYFDIERLLIIANEKTTTPQYWAVQTFGITLGVFGLLIALEGFSYWQTGTVAIAFPMVFVITGIIPLLFFIMLRSKAQRKKADITLAIEDSLVEMAILSFSSRVAPREAMLMLARCHKNPALIEALDSPRWLALLPENRKKGAPTTKRQMSITTEYELMGKALGINIMIELGSAIRQVQEKGSPATEVYVRLAKKVYSEKQAKAKVEASAAKTKTTVVMTLLIIPLLALIGAPLAAQLGGGFGK